MAAHMSLAGEQIEVGGPPVPVGFEKPSLALFKFADAGILKAKMRQFALDADEFGARIALLLEPVSVAQPRDVVVRVVVNVAEQVFREAHATPRSDPRTANG